MPPSCCCWTRWPTSDRLDDDARTRVPVPVLFTAHGWDPTTTSVRDWLAERLVATYPMFQHSAGPAETAALVAARDKIALILDGLDEMDHALRPAARQALGDAPSRVVVLSRSQEMVAAASGGWLVGAVAVHLHDVTATEAADYLARARTGPAPAGWTKLVTHLREHPDGGLARGLSTPLTLTLLRDTYQAGDDVSNLLDPTRYRTSADLERHLLAVGLVLGFVVGLVLSLALELPDVLVEAGAPEGKPVGPSETWSKDRMGGLVSCQENPVWCRCTPEGQLRGTYE